MMDCDTTGIEPDLALVKYKKLVGGGLIKIVNNTVPAALFKLGYAPEQVSAIVSYIDATGTIEGAPHIKDEHLAVFDCSFKPSKGTRSIHYMGHLRMMAATQPFISGAISQDRQPARSRHRRRDRRGLHPGLEARPEGGRHLSRRLQEVAAHGGQGRQQDRQNDVANDAARRLHPLAVAPRPHPTDPIDERDADGPPPRRSAIACNWSAPR